MGAKHATVNELTPFRKALIFCLNIILRAWYKTLKFTTETPNYESIKASEKLVGITWHNRVFFTPMMKVQLRRKLPMVGLVSPSRDGAWLAALFEFFGVPCVRGSNARHGAKALVELIKAVDGGSSIFVTPDGPRGPRYKAKEGALLVAKKTGARILVIRLDPRRFFTLNTWDRFIIPLPFTKVRLDFEEFENFEALEAAAAKKGMGAPEYIEGILGNAP